ncbi:MAG: hypothetical protein MUF27_13325 [Acidobacteria bacterium]|jgi:hypothetical protein|nr:hypothetical protein [Acidobacteriota bacterium]
MPVSRCPQCGAARDAVTTDPMACCHSCGALLAGGAAGGTLVARARFEPHEARLKVARALAGRGRAWLPGVPELVLVPFAATGNPRQPFRPLAALPPLLGGGWRPAGAGLAQAAPAGAPASEPGPRAAASRALPAPALIVQYPLYRVPLVQGEFASAAWCDGVDGRVVLPPELSEPPRAADGRRLGRWAALAAAIGLAGGLLLPFPLSALGVAVGGAVFWWAAGRP